ncbi:hypothetical protein GW17_00038535 [Ensete ventricosum]|nr:hypothetical protein GW17_00038535 [Ensete ventricosum]
MEDGKAGGRHLINRSLLVLHRKKRLYCSAPCHRRSCEPTHVTRFVRVSCPYECITEGCMGHPYLTWSPPIGFTGIKLIPDIRMRIKLCIPKGEIILTQKLIRAPTLRSPRKRGEHLRVILASSNLTLAPSYLPRKDLPG